MSKNIEMPHLTTPLMVKLKTLKEVGYDQEYQITETGLQNIHTRQIFRPKEIKIMDHFRYEGISNPDDMAILFTLVTTSGEKGTIIDAFGPYGNMDLMDFVKQVEDHTIDNL